MSALGPFEARPHLAVAVSGGSDSVALMRLLVPWCAAQGGRLSVLTLDHGLRPEAREEAQQVVSWATAVGADADVLRWRGEKPESGLQAAARSARYRLLTDWCRRHDVLHLVLGHQADDQRETVAMRQARLADAAGPAVGLAGMSAIVPAEGVRLLRPLLGITRASITGYLESLGQDWLEDPSNRSARFERIRWRQGQLGALPEMVVIQVSGRERRQLELKAADFLMRSAVISPAGYALIDASALAGADWDTCSLAIGQLLSVIGGEPYRPAGAALVRDIGLVLAEGRTRSLGGCLIGRFSKGMVICREAAGAEPPLSLAMPGNYRWDRRFGVEARAVPPAGLLVDVLGESGLREMGETGNAALYLQEIPPLARASLPACRDATGRLIRVPFTGFDPFRNEDGVTFRFQPNISATSSGFTVA